MNFLDLLYPAKCVMCDTILNGQERGVCSACRKQLPLVEEPFCKHCGKPVGDVREELCLDCRSRDTELEQGRALWVYTDKMRKAIANYKYGGCLEDGDFYADELYQRAGFWIRKKKIQCIVPVPIHWRKRWFRGFNQSTDLAGKLGGRLSLPVLDHVLVRKRATQPQKTLDNRQRASNLRGVFGIDQEKLGELNRFQRILLLDDIYTTGATLEECAGTLKRHGDFQVYSLCLCIGKDY